MSLTGFILSLVLIIVKAELETDKMQACDRGIKIVAASKTEENGIFHIFEDYKAWLYDAENQTILEYYDIEAEVKKHSANSPIIRATRVRSCFTPDGFGLQDQQFITENKIFQYEDIRNASSWKVTDQRKRMKVMAKMFLLALDDLVTTVGSACEYDNGKQIKYIHVFTGRGLFRFCRSDLDSNIDCHSKRVGVYPAFSDEKTIKETSATPDALSLDFDVLKSNPRVLFVLKDKISYWTLGENGEESLVETTVGEVFGCEHEGAKVMVIMFVLVGVVTIAAILAVVIVAVLLIRSKTGFEEDQTTSVYNAKTVVNKIGKKRKVSH